MNLKSFESTVSVSDGQVDHASKWVVEFIKTFGTELSTNGVPYALLYEEYAKTTNFPIGDKKFAVMLHVAGLERIKRKNVVTYISLARL